jgi:hypothetical protein
MNEYDADKPQGTRSLTTFWVALVCLLVPLGRCAVKLASRANAGEMCAAPEPRSGADGCQTYSQCEGGAEVTLCTARGGGHVTGDAKTAWPLLKAKVLP